MCISPSISPFFNPIEEFWFEVNYGVKRQSFDGSDTLTPRIVESCSVTQKDCQEWIRHSVSFFECCRSMKKNL